MRKSLFFILFVLFGVCAGNAQAPEPKIERAPPVQAFSWSLDSDGGYLGIRTEEISKDNLGKFGLREVKGVGVESVVDGSPAQTGGLQKGDVILRVNGDEITSGRKLTRLINEISPDHQARLVILRSGSEREIVVTVGKRPGFQFENGAFAGIAPLGKIEMRDMPDFSKLPRVDVPPMPPLSGDGPFVMAFGNRRQIGAALTPLGKQLAAHFGVESGALVNDVRENSPAAKAGLKAGDIIVEVDGKPVKGDFDVSRAVAGKKEGAVTLTIVRDRNRQTLSVTPEEVKGNFEHFFEFDPPDAPDTPAAPGVFKLVRPSGPPSPPRPADRILVPGRVI